MASRAFACGSNHVAKIFIVITACVWLFTELISRKAALRG